MSATDSITAAIESSMAAAGLTESNDAATDTTDTGSTEAPVEAGSTTDEGTTPDGESSAAAGTETSPSAGTVAPKEPVAPPVETAEQKRDREDLAALGIKAPKPGERENRLPHSRVSQMVLKGVARGREEAKAQLAEQTTKIANLEGIAAEHARLNLFADKDPERMIEAFAVANPTIWKPILERFKGTAPAMAAAAATAPAKAGTPMPKPNFKLPDGSMTYDQEGLVALLQWNRDEATAAAEAKFESRLSPLEKERAEERRQADFQAAQAPKIAAQIKTARETWGALFEADYEAAEKTGKSEILDYQRANRCSFEQACQSVLLPKLRAERTAMRASILEEINGRKGASTETIVPAKTVPPPGSRKLEDVIAESMAAAGLK